MATARAAFVHQPKVPEHGDEGHHGTGLSALFALSAAEKNAEFCSYHKTLSPKVRGAQTPTFDRPQILPARHGFAAPRPCLQLPDYTLFSTEW